MPSNDELMQRINELEAREHVSRAAATLGVLGDAAIGYLMESGKLGSITSAAMARVEVERLAESKPGIRVPAPSVGQQQPADHIPTERLIEMSPEQLRDLKRRNPAVYRKSIEAFGGSTR